MQKSNIKEIEQNLIFDNICSGFYENKACVKIKNTCFEIDTNGKILFKIKAQELYRFDENSFAIQIHGKWGIIDNYQEYIIEPKYDDIGHTGDYLYVVKLGDKYGIINQNNDIEVDFKYDYLDCVSVEKSYFLAESNGKAGIISLYGDIIIPIKYDEINYCINDYLEDESYFSAKYNNKWFFLDEKGNPLKINAKDFIDELDTVEKAEFLFDGKILE